MTPSYDLIVDQVRDDADQFVADALTYRRQRAAIAFTMGQMMGRDPCDVLDLVDRRSDLRGKVIVSRRSE